MPGMEKVCRKYQNAQVLSPLFIKTSLLSLPLSKSCKKVVLIVLNCVWFFTYARPAVFVSTELAAVKILMQFFNPGIMRLYIPVVMDFLSYTHKIMGVT